MRMDNVFVTPGDHIPGIPRHMVKFGGDYAFTPQFKLGADVLVVGAQYFVGDDANQNPKLPLYWVANLHASYQVDEHVQFFGLINNLFNNRNRDLRHVLRYRHRCAARLADPLHRAIRARSHPCSRSPFMAA